MRARLQCEHVRRAGREGLGDGNGRAKTAVVGQLERRSAILAAAAADAERLVEQALRPAAGAPAG